MTKEIKIIVLLFIVLLFIENTEGIIISAICCETACTACNFPLGWFAPLAALPCVPGCMVGSPVLAPCIAGGAWPNICLPTTLLP